MPKGLIPELIKTQTFIDLSLLFSLINRSLSEWKAFFLLRQKVIVIESSCDPETWQFGRCFFFQLMRFFSFFFSANCLGASEAWSLVLYSSAGAGSWCLLQRGDTQSQRGVQIRVVWHCCSPSAHLQLPIMLFQGSTRVILLGTTVPGGECFHPVSCLSRKVYINRSWMWLIRFML